MRRDKKLLFALLALLFALFPLTALAGNPVQDARDGVVCIALRVDARGYNGVSFSEVVSTGTGFFIGKKNAPVQYIVTNRHVIECEEADELRRTATVELIPEIVFEQYDSESTVEATVVKKFSSQDLAILKLETPTKLRKALPLSRAESLRVTDEVYALGFPDLSDDDDSGDIHAEREAVTVTKGYVTRARAVLDGDDYFQLDAKLSYGNSGGPVLTADGRVVGIASRLSFNANYTETMGAALWVEYLTEYLNAHGIAYDKGGRSLLPLFAVVLSALAAGLLFLRLRLRRPKIVPASAASAAPAVSPLPAAAAPKAALPAGVKLKADFRVGDTSPDSEQPNSELLSNLRDF